MFRISTEDVNRDKILDLVRRKFDAFTVVPQLGFWKGTQEHSLAIEIAGANRDDVLALAGEIKTANKQDAVLVQQFADSAVLV